MAHPQARQARGHSAPAHHIDAEEEAAIAARAKDEADYRRLFIDGSPNTNALQRGLTELDNRLSDVRDAQCACEVLEQLITPVTTADTPQIDRGDLGHLLRVLNRNLREAIGNAEAMLEQARALARGT